MEEENIRTNGKMEPPKEENKKDSFHNLINWKRVNVRKRKVRIGSRNQIALSIATRAWTGRQSQGKRTDRQKDRQTESQRLMNRQTDDLIVGAKNLIFLSIGTDERTERSAETQIDGQTERVVKNKSRAQRDGRTDTYTTV